MARVRKEARPDYHGPLVFDHVRVVLPDADEESDPLDAADSNSLLEGVAESSTDDVLCACSDEDDCAHAINFDRFKAHPEYVHEPRDYAALVEPAQEGDEMLPISSGTNTHRGVRCRRK